MPGFKTDHSIPHCVIAFNDVTRGPGYWKLNVDLLKDNNYTEQLSKIIDIELKQNYQNYKITCKWEMVKLLIRNFTLKYATQKAKS